ncbi:MAG: hypothetical protein Q9218_002851 [Villophora microphyllina]
MASQIDPNLIPAITPPAGEHSQLVHPPNNSHIIIAYCVLQFRDTQNIARVGICCTKVSFLLFFQRLFIPAGTRWTAIWWSIWIVFWLNVLYAFSIVITVSTECIGKEQVVVEGGHCVNDYAVLICASTINVVTDIMILIIPIACIWGLHMPTRKKLKILAIFTAGALTVLSSVGRLGYEIVAAKDPNQSYALMVISLLKLLELFMGVIVSCMPILPAFYTHLRGTAAANTGQEDFSTSILGHQSRNKSATMKDKLSTKRSKRSKKDPFPVSTNGEIATRGYEELNELEHQPQVHITRSDWEMQQPRRAALPPTVQVYDLDRAIVKDTEIEVRSEPRDPSRPRCP